MTFSGNRIPFGTVDYVLLSIMLLGSMAIGLFFVFWGKGQSTQVEYLLGGRRFKALPVCLSLFASFMSAISLIGVPTEIYTYGTMYTYTLIGLTLSNVLAMFTLVPLFYPLRLTSVYEYLNMRFKSRTVQLLGAAFGFMSTLSYMTVALLSPALALETAVGIPLWLSIVLVGAVGTVYTALGGMKSIIWTDVFQTVIIFAGIIIVIIKGSVDAGGFGKVWQINKETGRLVFNDISLDPRVRHTVWNLSVGVTMYWLGHHFSQTSVQRLVSTRSIHDANKVYLFAIPFAVAFYLVLILTGLVLVAHFYVIGCDPLAAGYVNNVNQLVPYFVIHILSFLPGLPGIYISTIFAAALSTLSSGINSLAANTVQDFLPWCLRHRSEAVVTTTTKILVCFFGTISTGIAYLFRDFEGPVIQVGYSIVAATNGPLSGLFLLGGLFPQANYAGALVGFASSVVLSYWLAVGSSMFRYSTETLPMGPTDRCISGNGSSIAVTPEYPFTARYNVNDSFDLTTSSTLQNIQEMDALGLAQRDFSLYDISYVLAPVIGIILTVLIGLTASFISNHLFSKTTRPEAKFLFPFCREFWYSERDVVDTEMD